MAAPTPDNEAARLDALRRCGILDTDPEPDFDDVARLAARICGAPIAAVSLVDERRQWFKSIVGLDASETSRDVAFCAHTILRPDLLIVPDAALDPRFAANPLVTGEPHIRFYAGAPLVTAEGHSLGSLCVIDLAPRSLTPEQEDSLRVLARQVAGQIALRRSLAERDQAEAQHRRLAAIIQSSADAITAMTLDGVIVTWSPGAERLYGYAAAEVVGRHASILAGPAGASPVPDVIQRLRRGEDVPSIEVTRRRKDGRQIAVLLTFTPLRDGDGALTGVAGVGRDITDQKRAEATLQKERQFLGALLESLSEGIVACDAAGTLTLFNRATREFHGLPERPLPPEVWAEHFDLYEGDGLTPMRTEDIPLLRALRGGVVRDAEMMIVPRSGPARTLLASGRAIHGPDGEKLGAVVAMHDITARKQMERELARLAAIVESSEEAIIGATLDGTVVSWNAGAERLYGYAAAQIIGRPASVLVPPGHESLVPAVTTRLRRGEAPEPVEVLHARRDGAEFHAALSFSPIRDAAGEMVGLACIARDITDRVRAEEALRESEARLRYLADAAFEGIAVSQDGVVVDANDAFVRLYGYGALDEVVGLQPGAFAAPESRALVRRKHRRGEETVYEAVCQRRDGTRFHAEVRGRHALWGGRPARVTAVRDISARKAAEEAMRAAEEKYRGIFEGAIDGIFRSAPNGGFIEANPALARMLGYDSPGDLIAALTDLGPQLYAEPADRARFLGLLREQRSVGGFEVRFRRRDGGVLWASMNARLVTEDGLERYVEGTIEDITARHEAEEQVRDYAVVLEAKMRELEAANAELETLATTDGLTGLLNHRTFRERLGAEFRRAARYNPPLSLLLLDVDHFKEFNDSFGHPAGDEVLRVVAHILGREARGTDVVARYGGEEFVIVMPQTGSHGAGVIAERVRAAVADTFWDRRPVTVSVGVSTLTPDVPDPDALISRADQALYRSKAQGRNRVTHARPLREAPVPPR